MKEYKHLGTYGIIIKDEEILLITKVSGPYDGKLDLPGGGIEHTETPRETLDRELMEEINGTVKNATLLDVTATNIKWEMEEDLWEDLHHVGILYSVELENDKLKSDADGLDSEGANWYDIASLNENELSPFAKVAIQKIKNEN